MVNLVGQRLGNYQLIRLLGSGNFADVYLGEHIYIEVPASIKVLRLRMQKDESELFRREARLIAHLDHPHIIRVFDFDIIDGTPFFVMQYAPGGTLLSRHPKGVRLTLEQIIVYVKQIASALQYAHEQKVIHRDIKPENILLGPYDEVLLSDFGLAVVQQSMNFSGTQKPAGTPLYMAPEQINGSPCAASDQYALAVIVYEWLCGIPPFQGGAYEVLAHHLYTPPPGLCAKVPTLSPTIEEVVLGALAKDPRNRFASVQDFADILEQVSVSTQPLSSKKSAVPQSTDPPATPTSDVSSYSTQSVTLHPLQTAVGEKSQLDTPHPPPGSSQSSANLSPLQRVNRQRLLAKVRSFWIKGVMEQSLQGAALITLGLHEQADAVVNPWELVLRQPDTTQRPLPAGTYITQVYHDAGGELLILGAPGSGKTTLLLQLARDLLDRAERNENHPLPMVFNLSSWTLNRQPIEDWLVEELNSKYQVPRKLAQSWVDTDQVLPLLDGLDEVTPVQRTACIEAINAYRQEHGLVPIVVCSRTADYLAQTTRVLLRCAVVVQPLKAQQIDEYLAQAGEQLAAVRMTLRSDQALQELATTPLMLSILTLAYHGMSVRDLSTASSPQMRRQQIFEQYVQRMLDRRGISTSYTRQQTIQWLAWLARQLVQHNQTEYYIERMQADWLPEGRSHQLYQSIAPRLLGGLAGGLVGGLIILLIAILVPGINLGIQLFYALLYALIGVVVGVLMSGRKTDAESPGEGTRSRAGARRSFARNEHLRNGLLAGCVYWLSGVLIGLITGGPEVGLLLALILGLGLGLVSGLVGVLIGVLVSVLTSGRKAEIKPVEVINWSWTSMGRSFIKAEHLRNGLFVGLVVGLVVGLGFGLGHGLSAGLTYGLGGGLIGLIVCWLVYGLSGGLSSDILDKRYLITPNQGIRRSARNALLVGLGSGLTIGLVFGVVFGLAKWLIFGQVNVLEAGLLGGLLVGLGGGLLSALLSGGDACIKHVVLRFFLWQAKLVSWNYPRFLDYATECILLRRVGGGYIFVHRLLLDYFASLNITTAFMQHDREQVQDISAVPTQLL